MSKSWDIALTVALVLALWATSFGVGWATAGTRTPYRAPVVTTPAPQWNIDAYVCTGLVCTDTRSH